MASAPTSRLQPASRELLYHLIEHPGATNAELRAALPHNQVIANLASLRKSGYLLSEREHDARCYRHYAIERIGEQQVPAPVTKPAPGPLVPPREVKLDAPWPGPYLSDAGVRRDGLDYRNCPSRRGNQFVYCYQREA